MQPRSDTLFGVDEDATVGDFLAGLYLMIGGPSADAQACLDVLTQYGAVSADQDLSQPLTEQFLCDLLNAIGAGMTTDTPDTVMTRGDLADLFAMLGGE